MFNYFSTKEGFHSPCSIVEISFSECFFTSAFGTRCSLTPWNIHYKTYGPNIRLDILHLRQWWYASRSDEKDRTFLLSSWRWQVWAENFADRGFSERMFALRVKQFISEIYARWLLHKIITRLLARLIQGCMSVSRS